MAYLASETTVVLLAAGHGKRMLPLTANTPKPLLRAGDKCLIEHHLFKLHQQGFRNVVINIAYEGEQIRTLLGDGGIYGLKINYSDEIASGPLETAGGLRHALPLIESNPFLVVNADIWTNYPFAQILKPLCKQGRLLMVNNPAHHTAGDFSIDDDSGLLTKKHRLTNSYTFSGIGLYHKEMLIDVPAGPQALAPLFIKLIEAQQLEAEFYDGLWRDIGTPERLIRLNESLSSA